MRQSGWRWLILAALFVCLPLAAQAEGVPLTEVVRRTMSIYFDKNRTAGNASSRYANLAQSAMPTSGKNTRSAGVFVTLSRDGKTRACWGSIESHRQNVVEATIDATLGALTKEYRYPPVSPSEWRTLKPQVTVIRALEPLEITRGVPHGLNPLRDGLMVRTGGKSGVMLPGEARDAVYQVVQARLKAGIGPNEPFQSYRIVADVYQ